MIHEDKIKTKMSTTNDFYLNCLRGRTVNMLGCHAALPGSISDPGNIFTWPAFIFHMSLGIICGCFGVCP